MAIPRKPKRSIADVIDKAIDENRAAERLLYAFAVVLFAAGVYLIVHGSIANAWMPTVTGAIAGSVCIPAVYLARRTRQENIEIRLMEAALVTATSSEDAARVIAAYFLRTNRYDAEMKGKEK